jgi:hypothetical protein
MIRIYRGYVRLSSHNCCVSCYIIPALLSHDRVYTRVHRVPVSRSHHHHGHGQRLRTRWMSARCIEAMLRLQNGLLLVICSVASVHPRSHTIRRTRSGSACQKADWKAHQKECNIQRGAGAPAAAAPGPCALHRLPRRVPGRRGRRGRRPPDGRMPRLWMHRMRELLVSS